MATAVIPPKQVLTELEILKLSLANVKTPKGYEPGKQCIYNVK